MKKEFILARVGKRFIILWRGGKKPYWTKYGSQTFETHMHARRHAVDRKLTLSN
jgi:hypothetical protein